MPLGHLGATELSETFSRAVNHVSLIQGSDKTRKGAFARGCPNPFLSSRRFGLYFSVLILPRAFPSIYPFLIFSRRFNNFLSLRFRSFRLYEKAAISMRKGSNRVACRNFPKHVTYQAYLISRSLPRDSESYRIESKTALRRSRFSEIEKIKNRLPKRDPTTFFTFL